MAKDISTKEMEVKEIIEVLLEARTYLEILKDQVDFTGYEDVYEAILCDIDIVGCELTQNIAKKLNQVV